MNLFAYVKNRPTIIIDSEGLRGGGKGIAQLIQSIRNLINVLKGLPRANPDNRAPGASESNCHEELRDYCDEDGWCCDYCEKTKTCNAMCPMISSPDTAKKAVKQCVKFHKEKVTVCEDAFMGEHVTRYPQERR